MLNGVGMRLCLLVIGSALRKTLLETDRGVGVAGGQFVLRGDFHRHALTLRADECAKHLFSIVSPSTFVHML